MSWLADYQDDLLALEKARGDVFPVDLNDEEQIKNFIEDFKSVFAPLEDGSLDPADIEKVFDVWWEKFSAIEIATARKEAPIHHRLAPLYARLEKCTDEEWEEYAKMLIRVRLQSRPMQLVMQSIAKSNTASSEAQASIEKLNKLLGE